VERNKIVLPILGALLAAIIGGAIWAVIAVVTDYELGLIAWGIGGLAGYAVVLFSNRQTSQIHQIIAVIASLIGILLGKYFIFSYIINDGFEGVFNSEIINLFKDNISDFFGGMDIVFVLFAVVTAWKLPSQMSNQVIQSPTQPQEPSV
jgi:fucose permease